MNLRCHNLIKYSKVKFAYDTLLTSPPLDQEANEASKQAGSAMQGSEGRLVARLRHSGSLEWFLDRVSVWQ